MNLRRYYARRYLVAIQQQNGDTYEDTFRTIWSAQRMARRAHHGKFRAGDTRARIEVWQLNYHGCPDELVEAFVPKNLAS